MILLLLAGTKQGQQVQKPLVEAKQTGAAKGTQLAQDAVAGAAQCSQSFRAMTAIQSFQQAG